MDVLFTDITAFGKENFPVVVNRCHGCPPARRFAIPLSQVSFFISLAIYESGETDSELVG
jgi:hypothetical protein